MSPNLSVSPSDSTLQLNVANTDEEPLRSISRGRIELAISADATPSIHTTILGLVERYVPGVPRLIMTEDRGLVLRLRHSYIRALPVDQLTCRIARLKGVSAVHAELRRSGEGVVYAARMQGR
ncbi:MAG: hypothetical protein HN644_09745 [Rhodospirillales bacterium]|jgi:hypothetical protein|nr:hypothetical protein [Rhodospirillales bacterium]MBT4041075.1 hypothetical protein [Rhodospirillales bacterium]MBT4628398.1 hypothetical protein [Rhodospirillales bacterium]MBT5350815.1 hypothetical protein [Rhodospirillales bacterium]MBT5522134.1 hypothetical protein [Rhodospirillales bacterium]